MPDCWLEVSIRKVLRPATSTQVFLGFPVPKSKWWDGSPRFQVATTCFSCSPPDLNLLVSNFMFCIHVKQPLPPDDNPIAVNKYYYYYYLSVVIHAAPTISGTTDHIISVGCASCSVHANINNTSVSKLRANPYRVPLIQPSLSTSLWPVPFRTLLGFYSAAQEAERPDSMRLLYWFQIHFYYSRNIF